VFDGAEGVYEMANLDIDKTNPGTPNVLSVPTPAPTDEKKKDKQR
jgi:hypothetical protein